ncbi:hypothetical protein K474DRAFT_1622018 [Panus rudis PR-1116 ss-1]|nr:hypothetical protein K474DRAFT_1622018 [Panus rudis PR-1116 ss-1]
MSSSARLNLQRNTALRTNRVLPTEARVRQARIEDLFFNSVIGNDLLHGRIFDDCHPSALLCFRATCRRAYYAVEYYIRRMWNIHRFLSRYFDNPLEFRQLQAQTGMLISGSSALQFFDRTFYPGSDLDLYVPMVYREEVGNYLLDCGYTYTPHGTQNTEFHEAVWESRIVNAITSYFIPGVAGIFNFLKSKVNPATEEREWLKVQVIVSANCPVASVLYFHSTCVMNLISFEAAYSLYPRATLEERKSLICQSRSINREEAIDKYRQRGWELINGIEGFHDAKLFHVSLPNSRVPSATRWVGDRHCWTMQLDTSGIMLRSLQSTPRSKPLSRDPALGNSWKVDLDRLEYPYKASMTFTPVQSPFLYFGYICGTDQVLQAICSSLPLLRAPERPTSNLPFSAQMQTWIFYDEEFVAACRAYFDYSNSLQIIVASFPRRTRLR